MKGAPPFLELLFNLCPLCVIAMPILTVLVLIKLMAKPNKDTPMLTDIPPEDEPK
jgi:hypothetical protein